MILDSCGQGCGWIAGLIGCIGYGSFGVPLKGEATNSVDGGKGAHIFVLQTYKTLMMFSTSWLVLLLGEKFHFDRMGLLSGLLWVTGGMTGIFGIRNAGLAISVGTWSGVTVSISFLVGVFVFGERVHSVWATVGGVVMLLLGFVGMSYFSSPGVVGEDVGGGAEGREVDVDDGVPSVEMNDSGKNSMLEPLLNDGDTDGDDTHYITLGGGEEAVVVEGDVQIIEMNGSSPSCTDNDVDGEEEDEEEVLSQTIQFLGMEWNRRMLGILGAATDGVLGGSILIPMHYSSVQGLGYVISFGIGAATVTIFYWVLFLLYNTYQTDGTLTSGYALLPSMHLKTLLLPGVVAGTTWSIGNIGNILSVTYLGESVGMSVVQCQMIVSGLWGILWFKEIRGWMAIMGWMLAALLTLGSIMVLGREHVS